MKCTKLTIVWLVLLCGFGNSGFSQNAQIGLTITEGAAINLPQGPGTGSFSVGGPQFGITWQNKFMNSHEVKLSGISFGYSGEPENILAGLGARYQYRHFLFKERQSKLQPFVLGEASLGLGYARWDQGQTGAVTNFNISTALAVGPGMRWNFSDRMYLDVSVPVKFTGANFLISDNSQPNIGANTQTHFSFRPAQIRLDAGIGIYLWNKKERK